MIMMKKQEISVHCGRTTDSFESLEQICKERSDELKNRLDFSTHQSITITFWTEDFPELICVGTFSKDENGVISYELDYSETTL